MAYSMDRIELWKMRQEIKSEQMSKIFRLQEEVGLLTKDRDWISNEISRVEKLKLTDEECDLQNERELRLFRRDRKMELLHRRQKIEEELMLRKRELDKIVLEREYRENLEKLEDEREADFESKYDDQVTVDECVSEFGDAKSFVIPDYDKLGRTLPQRTDGKFKPQRGITGSVSGLQSERPGITKQLAFKSEIGVPERQEGYVDRINSKYRTTEQEDSGGGLKTEGRVKCASTTWKLDKPGINTNQLESTALEKSDKDRVVQIRTPEVSAIYRNRGDSSDVQNTFLRNIDSEIQDLDRHLERLNTISTETLGRMRERIHGSSQSERFIDNAYERIQKETPDLQNRSNYFGHPSSLDYMQEGEGKQNSRRYMQGTEKGIDELRATDYKYSESQSSAKRECSERIKSDAVCKGKSRMEGADKERKLGTSGSVENQNVKLIEVDGVAHYEDRAGKEHLDVISRFVSDQGRIMKGGVKDQIGYQINEGNRSFEAKREKMGIMYTRQENRNTRNRIPDIHEDREMESLLVDRTQKESRIMETERQIKKKEKEIQERQQRLELQEEFESRRRTLDPYDNILQEKERVLEQKLKALQAKEEEIKRREDQMKELSEKSEARLRALEKEILTYREQSIIDNKEASAKITSMKFPLQQTEHAEMVDSEKINDRDIKQDTIQDSQVLTQDRPYYFPKFTVFSGEDPKPKKESTFEEWKYEVDCVRKDKQFTEAIVAQAIRKSLSGQAKRVVLPLGTTATVEQMIEKLEGVFGNVATGMSVLEEFYSSSQKQGESVNAWSLRLEEILQRAIDKGHAREEEKDKMLKEKFWRCLRSERLRNATQMYYHTIDSFELLRRKVRAEEYEMQIKSGIQHQPLSTTSSSGAQATGETTLLDRIASLEQELNTLKNRKPGFYNRRRQNQGRPQNSTDSTQSTETQTSPLNM